MANAARRWGMRTYDFVGAVERLEAPAVVRLFESEIKACGFHVCVMAGLRIPGTARPELAVSNGLPTERFGLTTHENFSVMDPFPIA